MCNWFIALQSMTINYFVIYLWEYDFVEGVGRSIHTPMHRDIHLGDIQIDTPVYERR